MITKKLLTELIEGKKLRKDTWLNQSFYIGIGDDGILRAVDSKTGEKTCVEFSFHHKKALGDGWSEYKELYTFEEMYKMMFQNVNCVFRLSCDEGSYEFYKYKYTDGRYRIVSSCDVNSENWDELHLMRIIKIGLENKKVFELISE